MGTSLFHTILPKGISAANSVEHRLLAEYGAVFVAQHVTPPTKIVFEDPGDVRTFQSGLSVATDHIGGFEMELQSPAMGDLQSAIEEAEEAGLTISPRDTDSARRSYEETVG